MFKIPSIIRKAAETDVPIILPTLLKSPNLELIVEAVAATAMDVTTTILRSVQKLDIFFCIERRLNGLVCSEWWHTQSGPGRRRFPR